MNEAAADEALCTAGSGTFGARIAGGAHAPRNAAFGEKASADASARTIIRYRIILDGSFGACGGAS